MCIILIITAVIFILLSLTCLFFGFVMYKHSKQDSGEAFFYGINFALFALLVIWAINVQNL